MTDLNLRRICRDCKRDLESAQAHMLAVGPIKHLNAVFYAAGVFKLVETLLDYIPKDDEYYEQLKAMSIEALSICERFEKSFEVLHVTTKDNRELIIAPVPEKTVVIEPNGATKPVDAFEGVVRKLLATPPMPSPKKHREAKERPANRRLTARERMDIWQHFNGEKPARKVWKEYSLIAEMLNVTVPTVAHWADNHPGSDALSM